MPRFECNEGSSNKFWEIEQSGGDLNIRFGKIGTAGQSQTKNLADASAATTALTKLVKEKTGKGYVETTVAQGASIGASPVRQAKVAEPAEAKTDNATEAAEETKDAPAKATPPVPAPAPSPGPLRVGATGAKGSEDDGELLLLQLAHDNTTPMAIDAMSRALEGKYGTLVAVASEASIHAGQIRMNALAVLTSQGLIVPQLANAAAQSTAGAATHRQSDELQALLAASSALLAQWLGQGLRHQGGAAVQRANEHLRALRGAGLVHCASAFEAALEAMRTDGASALPDKLAALQSLLDTLANN